MTTLLVTNDFGPRIGGIESFCAAVCAFVDNDVVVLTGEQAGSKAFDAQLDYPVVRVPGPLLPTGSVARRAISLLRAHRCESVVFGAAAPLGLLAPRLRRAGAVRIVALTHGHETWWASMPGTAALLRRIGDSVDALTTISAYTESRIVPALSADGQRKIVRLAPPVDLDAFRPVPESADPRVCIAASRFVPQKGLVTLIRSWDDVTSELGDTYTLRLVGQGRQEPRLRAQASQLAHPNTVEFVGAVPHRDLPAQLASAGVFVLPVRTLRAGLYAEGLGLAFLEAAATGLPVVVGNSGGAIETVKDGETGIVVDPRQRSDIAQALIALLGNPERAAALGRAGRRFVEDVYAPAKSRATLRSALEIGD